MNKILLLFLSMTAGQLAAQCVNIDNCPAGTPNFSGQAPNSIYFWHESYWTNPNGVHDLTEEVAALSLRATNICPGQSLSFRYLLFLDTDYDNIQETVVNSAALPGSNTVNFNNVNNPGYTGGTPRAFDERPVPANQKYGFALQEIADGTGKTAYLKWNTQAAPAAYVGAQLPVGRHRIQWFVTNNLGEEETCAYFFTVSEDHTKPTVVCIPGLLSVDILPTQMVEIFDADIKQYVTDNVTLPDLLETAIRKTGGTTPFFPVDASGNPVHSVFFTCAEVGSGFIEVELWARDEAGNTDYCSTYVVIEDNAGNCGPVGTAQPDGIALQVGTAPNPVSDILRVNVQSAQETPALIMLSDQTGRDVWRKTETLASGKNTLEFPLAALPPGLYFLSIRDASGRAHVEKVVKQ